MSEGDACGSGCGYCGRCERGGPSDGTCEDCGAGIYWGAFDVVLPILCRDCDESRERWAVEQEARSTEHGARRMLKADLAAAHQRKEVA